MAEEEVEEEKVYITDKCICPANLLNVFVIGHFLISIKCKTKLTLTI